MSEEIVIFIAEHNGFFITTTVGVWLLGYITGIIKGLKLNK